MDERGIWRVTFVHLSARIHTVIAYRDVYLVAVQIDARFSPIVVGFGSRRHSDVNNGCGGVGSRRGNGVLGAYREALHPDFTQGGDYRQPDHDNP
jgi:hypothetical protein